MSFRSVVAVVFVLGSSAVQAQWTEPAADVVSTTDKVGIGVVSPTQKLEVDGNVRSIPATGSFAVGGAAPAGYQFFATNSATSVSTGFQLQSNYFGQATSFIGNFGQFGTYLASNREPQAGGFVNAAAAPNQQNAAQMVIGDTYRGRLFSLANFPGGAEAVHLIMNYAGNVGIGPGVETLMGANPTKRLVIAGDIEISGNINAKYEDLAEWVPASSDLEAGTVVVLDPALGNGVMASLTSYDTSVAGVVSAQPGIVLGQASATKEKIATTGRVRVKVDATAGPIAVGDLLVTGEKPGYAMRSVPVNVSGIQMHRPGTIVGKALEALPSGEGEILVLLSLQ